MKSFLLLFFILNTALYLGVNRYNTLLPFNKDAYISSAHHFIADPRIEGKAFNLVNALGQFDAQWYLKIAHDGYPTRPSPQTLQNKQEMGGLRYAFYPLYPLAVGIVNRVVSHVELSAFLVSNLFLYINFGSLYFVISKLYNKGLAQKAVFLLFFFPFSVFFRSYFAEGVYLFLLIWFSYFLIKRKLLYSALFLCLLNITKANGILLNFLFLYVTLKEFQLKKASLKKTALYLFIAGAGYLLWVAYVYKQTGDPFYFYSVLKAWYPVQLSPPPPLYNVILFVYGLRLPLVHSVHFSQIDMAIAGVTAVLLASSRKFLKPELWWISFCLWILPLVTRDFASFSRYQSVSFPLFIYLAHLLKSRVSFSLAIIFMTIGFGVTFLCFVNWYWIG